MGIKVIVFDWDGTLFDSMCYKPKNAGLVFSEYYGVQKIEIEKLFRKYSGIPRCDLFKQIAQNLNLDFSEDIYSVLNSHFTQKNIESSKSAVLFSEVICTIRELVKKFSLYISSASVQEELSKLVSMTGVGIFFKNCWGSSKDFNKGSDHFLKIINQENCNVTEILFVGDDEIDEQFAINFGVRFMRIARQSTVTQSKCLNVISNLKDLLEIVQ